jgi:hypothetical protein
MESGDYVKRRNTKHLQKLFAGLWEKHLKIKDIAMEYLKGHVFSQVEMNEIFGERLRNSPVYRNKNVVTAREGIEGESFVLTGFGESIHGYVEKGQWIVLDSNGYDYLMDGDAFAARYERVDVDTYREKSAFRAFQYWGVKWNLWDPLDFYKKWGSRGILAGGDYVCLDVGTSDNISGITSMSERIFKSTYEVVNDPQSVQEFVERLKTLGICQDIRTQIQSMDLLTEGEVDELCRGLQD